LSRSESAPTKIQAQKKPLAMNGERRNSVDVIIV